MAGGNLHLIKLCVGVEDPSDLEAWQNKYLAETGASHCVHTTRMWPRRDAEILKGGSLYWVMKGFIKTRQKIIGLEKVTGADGISRCAILLDPNMVNVELTPKRAFQGWRYFEGAQVPRDILKRELQGGELPEAMVQELARLGVR